MLLDLPTHWLGVVWALACVTAGWRMAVTDGAGADGAPAPADADVLVTSAATPDQLARYREVAVVSTRPLALTYGPGLPAGALDYAAEVAGCGDRFRPPTGPLDAAEPWWSAAVPVAARSSAADRILTGTPPTSAAGLVDVVLAPAIATASVVLVANLDGLSADRVEALAATERTTIRR